MNQRKIWIRKILLYISFILIGGLIVGGIVFWRDFTDKKYYDYTLSYPGKNLIFRGDYIENDLIVYGITMFNDRNMNAGFGIIVNEKKYKLSEIAANIVVLFKNEKIFKEETETNTRYYFHSGSGVNLPHNPPYSMIIVVSDDGRIERLSFDTKSTPDSQMGEPSVIPYTFYIGERYGNIAVPIEASSIERLLGKPDNIKRYRRFP